MSKLVRILSAAASAAGLMAYARFRREIIAIKDSLDRGSTVASTQAGPIEYAERGEGEPMLVIHGAGGGYDQGLLIADDLAKQYRIIAPSRFGYLNTPAPPDASPAAQADAHAALLDFLHLDKVIVTGASAGAPSAIELALRHPERVSAMILLVPRAFDPSESVGVDASAPSQAVLRLVEASLDFPFWLMMRVSRSSVMRFLGVRPSIEARATPAERQRVTQIMRSILPLSSRVRGIAVDSAAKISEWPLEKIRCPVLIVSAKDDLFRTLPGARFTAEHIKGAKLHVLDEGGHLMVGQQEQVHRWINEFLGRRSARVQTLAA